MVFGAGPDVVARPIEQDPAVVAETIWLKTWSVTLVLDVGANIGQTARWLRQADFGGRILSFEPIAECFEKLRANAESDPGWYTQRLALGTYDGTAQMGISENLVSSSLRPATDTLIAIHSPVRYCRYEEVALARLDGLFGILARPEDVVHLKIDTQGSEREVIQGATGCLERIGSVRMEVAVSEVYRGEMVLPEAITMMDERGYTLIEAWPAWRHPASHEVLHFDLLFRRRDHGPGSAPPQSRA